MSERTFDVIIYGATGFTGGLVARYFAHRAPLFGTRWAIAGRDPDRLQRVRESLRPIDERCGHVATLRADARDAGSLIEMAQQTRVVLTTVGPYLEHGQPLVAACMEGGADYVDITGEPEFVRQLVERHGAAAERSGVLIVNCCGMDSIPADLGALFTVSKLPAGASKQVDGFLSIRGRFSGGSWATALEILSRHHPSRRDGRSGLRRERPRFHYEEAVRGWAIPLPVIDPSIVRRSSEALPALYGPGFQYHHYLRARSLPGALAIAGGAVGLYALAQIGPLRALLKRAYPQGEGPSEEVRLQSFFQLTFIGKAGGTQVVTRVRGGDPGYTETAKMISEAALLLAHRRTELPLQGGVVTPAMAFGERLIGRLGEVGITFEVVEPAH